jgi:hypothetical protein
MNNSLLATLKTDGTIELDNSSSINLYQGSASYFKLTINSEITIPDNSTLYIQFRRSDGEQTSYLPMIETGTLSSYYHNLNSDWYFHKSGNLQFNIQIRKQLSENEVQILATASTQIYVNPTQGYNAVAPLKPQAIDSIELQLTNLDDKIDTTKSDLEEEIDNDIDTHNDDPTSHPYLLNEINTLDENKVDKDFGSLDTVGELNDDDYIAIDDGTGVKKLKAELVKNNVETVNNEPPDSSKNIKITGSNIERSNTDDEKIDNSLLNLETEVTRIDDDLDEAVYVKINSTLDEPLLTYPNALLFDGYTQDELYTKFKEKDILFDGEENTGTFTPQDITTTGKTLSFSADIVTNYIVPNKTVNGEGYDYASGLLEIVYSIEDIMEDKDVSFGTIEGTFYDYGTYTDYKKTNNGRIIINHNDLRYKNIDLIPRVGKDNDNKLTIIGFIISGDSASTDTTKTYKVKIHKVRLIYEKTYYSQVIGI